MKTRSGMYGIPEVRNILASLRTTSQNTFLQFYLTEIASFNYNQQQTTGDTLQQPVPVSYHRSNTDCPEIETRPQRGVCLPIPFSCTSLRNCAGARRTDHTRSCPHDLHSEPCQGNSFWVQSLAAALTSPWTNLLCRSNRTRTGVPFSCITSFRGNHLSWR